jgi:nucleoside 2-deoxyribosyltransferase
MKLYFAGKWSTGPALLEAAKRLPLGVYCQSNWLYIPTEKDSSELSDIDRWVYADGDLQDIVSADALVLFNKVIETDVPASPGRFIEFGYALALGRPVYVIGESPYSVFYSHPLVTTFDCFETFLKWITFKTKNVFVVTKDLS